MTSLSSLCGITANLADTARGDATQQALRDIWDSRGVREPGSMNWRQLLAGEVAGRLTGTLMACATPVCAPSA